MGVVESPEESGAFPWPVLLILAWPIMGLLWFVCSRRSSANSDGPALRPATGLVLAARRCEGGPRLNRHYYGPDSLSPLCAARIANQGRPPRPALNALSSPEIIAHLQGLPQLEPQRPPQPPQQPPLPPQLHGPPPYALATAATPALRSCDGPPPPYSP